MFEKDKNEKMSKNQQISTSINLFLSMYIWTLSALAFVFVLGKELTNVQRQNSIQAFIALFLKDLSVWDHSNLPLFKIRKYTRVAQSVDNLMFAHA